MAINLGATAISDVKLGSTQVDKIYLGATEVWSKGGSGPTDWGTVKYYSVYSIGYAADGEDSCTVNSINAATLDAFVEEKGDTGKIYFVYDENMGGWDYSWMGEIISPENMLATTGIDVTLDTGATYAEFMIVKAVTVDTTSPLTTVNLTQNEYNNLKGTDTYTIGSVSIPKNAVEEVIIGTLATSTPTGFLAGSENLKNIDFTYADSLTTINESFLASSKINQSLVFPSTLTTIGNSFMSSCPNFNQSLVLPNSVTSIGNWFLNNCPNFNQPLALPSSLTTIGQSFMTGCASFNQPLTLPDSVTSIGMQFLVNCSSLTATINLGTRPASITYGNSDDGSTFCVNNASVPAYTTGITIVGTYAADWKAKYPDKNLGYSNRKLIIGS